MLNFINNHPRSSFRPTLVAYTCMLGVDDNWGGGGGYNRVTIHQTQMPGVALAMPPDGTNTK